MKKKCDQERTKNLKYNLRSSDKSLKENVTHRDKKSEKCNRESVDDSPFSLFLPPNGGYETFLSWQMNKSIIHCDSSMLLQTAHHLFFCSSWRSFEFDIPLTV